MRATIVVVAAVLGLFGAHVVQAHHSYADFDVERTVTVQGTIEDILFANPHVVLKVRTRDAGLYTATWNAAGQLSRQGVSATHLKKGDAVVVVGNPSTKRAEVAKIREVRRPSDGWAWRMEDGRVSVTASR